MKLQFKKLKPEAITPTYSYHGDAGFDLYAAEKVILAPGERGAIPTGIALEISEGYVGLIWDKSGIAIKSGLKTIGGVIDAGYRGEILIGIINFSKELFTFEVGQKVAQMLIQKIEVVSFLEVKELSETHRGEKGFGSSKK